MAQSSQLDRATAYRLASCLAESGFVERDANEVYRLGLQAMQFGLAAMRAAPLLTACKPLMQRLARRTEDTVFLVVRNGDYAHCLHCEEGLFPVKALVLQVGGMRVLGLGSAGMALLSRLSDEEIESIYHRHTAEFEQSVTMSQLKKLVAQTRKQGCAMTDRLVNEEVGGVGMSFELNTGGHAAISIAAISSRMQHQRQIEISRLVSEELSAAGFTPAS